MLICDYLWIIIPQIRAIHTTLNIVNVPFEQQKRKIIFCFVVYILVYTKSTTHRPSKTFYVCFRSFYSVRGCFWIIITIICCMWIFFYLNFVVHHVWYRFKTREGDLTHWYSFSVYFISIHLIENISTI